MGLCKPRYATKNFAPGCITLPDGKVGVAYSGASLQSNGEPPIVWSIISDDFLATGLNLSIGGTISGTPTGAGVFDFEVKALRNENNNAASAWFTIFIEKGEGAVVESPVVDSDAATASSITVFPVAQPQNGQEVEYSVNTSNAPPASGWQTGLTFNFLSAARTYFVFARAKENENYFAGIVSQGVPATTADLLTWTGESPKNDDELKAWINSGRLRVSGLTVGKPWRVYNVAGALVYESVAQSAEADIRLHDSGVYIIQSENKTVRIVNR